jgi:hypothetical protein
MACFEPLPEIMPGAENDTLQQIALGSDKSGESAEKPPGHNSPDSV